METNLKPKTIHEFKSTFNKRGTIHFSAFKGKKILVVNPANKCCYTPRYKGLEKLYKKHQDNLVVVSFPADNFGHRGLTSKEENSVLDATGKWNFTKFLLDEMVFLLQFFQNRLIT